MDQSKILEGDLPKEAGHVDSLLPVIAYSVEPREKNMTGRINMLVLRNQAGQLFL